MPQPLLAFISSDGKDEHVKGLLALAKRLRGGWTVGDPAFVDHVDTDSATLPEDLPIRTLGISLPVSRKGEQPSTCRSELRQFVDALGQFSCDHGVEFEFKLDGDYAGDIRAGLPTQLLLQKLVKTW